MSTAGIGNFKLGMQLLATAILCAAFGLVSHQFLGRDHLVDLWRPAAGLGLAIVLIGGPRFALAVLAGALLADTMTHGNRNGLAMGLGGVVGPLLGAWLLRLPTSFDRRLIRTKDYLRLMMRAGVLGTLGSALTGTAGLMLLGSISLQAAPELALRWWMGDLLGVALMTPLVLVWWDRWPMPFTRSALMESALLIGLSFLAGQAVFLDWFTDEKFRSPIGYWMFLFVGWAALRLEREGVTLVLLIITTQALTGAYLGVGFFGEDLQTTSLMGFWRYMMVLAFGGMTLASFATERRLEAMTLTKQSLTLRDHALDKVQEGVTLGNPKRQLVYVNDAFLRLTGYSREELLNKSCGRLLQGPGTSPAITALLRDALAAGKAFHGEILNYRKDGTPFWNDLSVTPIFDAQGVLIEYFGVQRDITAAKEAALELKKSEEQLSLVLKGSNDGLWDWNVVTDTEERSARWYEMLGYDPQVDQKSSRVDWSELLHPDDLERANDELDAMLAGNENRYTLEVRLRHQKGHYVSVLSRAFVQRDDAGTAIRISGTITNLTSVKEREAKLGLSAAVLQQSREGIMMTDAQCNIMMVNPSFTAMTGYGEGEVLGKNPRFLASGRQDQDFFLAMWNAIKSAGHWTGEICNRRKDGSLFPAWLAISSLQDTNGTVTHYIGNLSDLSEAKAAENRILRLSHFDALTGLPNRVLLEDRTNHGISMVQRAGEQLTMMLIRIDHFRNINDTLGRTKGDLLLVEMAKRLSACVRDQDTLGRMGGKEFVLILPGTPSSGAAHLASELLWKLAEPYELGDQETTLTVSIGIAHYPDSGSDYDSLMKSAAIAMHRAQSEGRDTFQFYSDDMYQQVLEHDSITKSLRQAVKLDQLHLVYQPLVDLQTGQISGMEALLRWQHPERGAISPVEFIPIAEKSGLIKGIGEWVLRRACQDIRHWLDQGIDVPHVAVNVSPIQFQDPDLIGQVKSALAQWQISPEYLHIEVTESALMDNVGRSEAMLKELKSLGLMLSLDDFGTGYSSLSYLKRFPFDKVKIDRSFVTDIANNPSDQVIARVIISMAHGLGLKVIAEGVETEAQCELLRSSVCDEIQGYLYSKPLNTQDMEKLFGENRQLPPHLLRLQKPQRTLLLVDDEPNVLSSLKRLFRRDGYQIITANSGQEGLDLLTTNKVDVIISDQRMPGMTGVEFLRAAKISHPNTIRIVLSGYTELQSVTEAINEGAIYRFLTKPWEDDQLRAHIQQAFDYKNVLEENQQLDIKIQSANQQLVAANRQLDEALQDTQQKIERNETSLEIARQALQHIPIPMIGLDDEGLIVFTNAASEQLLQNDCPLLCSTLPEALPALHAIISTLTEGARSQILMNGTNYHIQWKCLGMGSRSQGKMITLTRSLSMP